MRSGTRFGSADATASAGLLLELASIKPSRSQDTLWTLGTVWAQKNASKDALIP